MWRITRRDLRSKISPLPYSKNARGVLEQRTPRLKAARQKTQQKRRKEEQDEYYCSGR